MRQHFVRILLASSGICLLAVTAGCSSLNPIEAFRSILPGRPTAVAGDSVGLSMYRAHATAERTAHADSDSD